MTAPDRLSTEIAPVLFDPSANRGCPSGEQPATSLPGSLSLDWSAVDPPGSSPTERRREDLCTCDTLCIPAWRLTDCSVGSLRRRADERPRRAANGCHPSHPIHAGHRGPSTGRYAERGDHFNDSRGADAGTGLVART